MPRFSFTDIKNGQLFFHLINVNYTLQDRCTFHAIMNSSKLEIHCTNWKIMTISR